MTEVLNPGSSPLQDALLNEVALRVDALLQEGQVDIFGKVVSQIECEVVKCVVDHLKGNYVRASKVLGIARMTLRRKLRIRLEMLGQEYDSARAS
jgi:DNA-binding protein Fis